MLKINFLLNSVNDAHSLRRVQDFKVHGFDVKVYGFLREKETTGSTDANIVGAFANSLSYKKRISIYKKGIKKAFEEGGKDNLWYYLGLDVALFATFFSHNTKYIYEECDLTQTYISNAFVGRVLELIDKKITSWQFRSGIGLCFGEHIVEGTNKRFDFYEFDSSLLAKANDIAWKYICDWEKISPV